MVNSQGDDQKTLLTSMREYITGRIHKRTEVIKYHHSEIYVLQLPNQSCAHTAFEILTGDPNEVYAVAPRDKTTGQREAFPTRLMTVSEERELWGGEWATIDEHPSLGLFLEEHDTFKTLSDQRDLRRYIDRRLRLGDRFAVIYDFVTSSGIRHCNLISSEPIAFGHNYSRQRMIKKAKGRSKKNQSTRVRISGILGHIRRCMAMDCIEEAPYRTEFTKREVRYALSIEAANILGDELPPPLPIKSILGAMTLTRRFKSKFPKLWSETQDARVTPVYEPAIANPDQTGAVHGLGCTKTTSLLQESTVLTMA